MQLLDEIVVTGYGKQRRLFNDSLSSGYFNKSEVASTPKKETQMRLPEVAQVETPTSVTFEIKTPYTILSDNNNTTIEMEQYDLPADYKYYCVPKIADDVFLLANIADWEQYNLLEGEANIFFENAYVGKTILDVRNINDTLNLSLGRDKYLSVKREKIRDNKTKKSLGTKSEETRAWKIDVRNNKKLPVAIVLIDQIPVSTNTEIEVIPEKLSAGKLNTVTGEVRWNLKLKSSENKELELFYKVKYPKDKNLIIE